MIFNIEGWNSQAHRGLPGNYESTNLNLRILSMRIDRSAARETENLIFETVCWQNGKRET